MVKCNATMLKQDNLTPPDLPLLAKRFKENALNALQLARRHKNALLLQVSAG